MIVAHLLHASKHNALYLTRGRPDLGLGALFKFFERFFFLCWILSQLFYCSVHSNIWRMVYFMHRKKMTDFKTHTSFSPAVFSSIERKHVTTCSQSPLALPEVKSSQFHRELRHHNLSPYISPTTVVQIWYKFFTKSPIPPQHKSVVNIQCIASRVTKRM